MSVTDSDGERGRKKGETHRREGNKGRRGRVKQETERERRGA